MHVLEAVIVAGIMFAAIASVANFRVSRSSLDPIEEMMDTLAKDQLNIWAATPLSDPSRCAGRNDLDRMVYEGIDGDHDRWNRLASWKFEPNLDSDLVVSNGRKTYTVHGSGDVRGSGANIWWGPELDYVYPTGTTSAVSGTEKLVVDLPAVHWADKTRLLGEAVRVRATYSTLTSDESQVGTWVPSALVGGSPEAQGRRFASNLTWALESGDPALTAEISPWELVEGDAARLPLRLRLDPGILPNTTAGVIPQDTTVTVSFPRGWAGAGWENLPAPWVNETPASGPLANSTLVATARGANASAVKLPMYVFAPTMPTRPFDILHAQLTNGSLGSSNLVVTFPGSVERGLPRVLAPTAPYPLRNNSGAIFGAAFANGGDEVRVTAVDIEIPGGYDALHHEGNGAPLFDGVDPDRSTPSTGWSRVDARHVRWEDPDGVVVAAGKAAQWAVSVHISPDVAAATSVEPANSNGPTATLRFANGFNVTSSEWGRSPGMIRMRVSPATNPDVNGEGGSMDGYPWESAAVGRVETVTGEGDTVLARLKNTTTYALKPGGADAVNIESAAANASLTVTDRLVPIGSTVVVQADLESLMSEMSRMGVESTLKLELYAPPSLACKPTRSWDLPTGSLPTRAVAAVLLWEGGLGVPGVYTAAQDGYVQRIEATGDPSWSKKVSGLPIEMERMESLSEQPRLLLSTSTGKVVALQARDGIGLWTSSVLAAEGAMSPGVSAIEYDALTDQVLVGTQTGTLVTMSASVGAELAQRDLAGGAISDIKATEQAIYVQTATKLVRIDRVTSQVVTFPSTGDAFAVGSAGVMVANLREVILLSPDQFTVLGQEGFGDTLQLAARGEATGDGVEDLVLVTSDLRVVTVDGALFTSRARALDSVGGFTPEMETVEGPLGTMEPLETCRPSERIVRYGSPLFCDSPLDRGPQFLQVEGGRTTVGYVQDGIYALYHFHANGELAWARNVPIGAKPHSGAVGTWALDPKAFVLGDESGGISITSGGQVVFQSQVSDRVGRFAFPIHIPEGGFFGTHLVVARLRWQTGSLHNEEARVMDWFDVVDPEGLPVPRPNYLVGLTLDRRDD